MKLVQTLLFSVLLAGLSHADAAQISPLNSVAAHSQVVFGAADQFVVTQSVATRDVQISHVPEPEGWTMYLLGLGFVVYQIRRRRNKSPSWDIAKKQ